MVKYYENLKENYNILQDFEDYESAEDESSFMKNTKTSREVGFNSCSRKLSKSSDCCQCSKPASSSGPRAGRRSDDSRTIHGKQMHHRHF